MMRLDSYIGDLLEVLEASGKSKDTVVVYIGDHGADLLRGKRTSYEGGVKIPMIIRWPGSKSGQQKKELVTTLDLFPTFCEIAGVAIPKSLPGQSLKTIAYGGSPKWRNYLFTEFHVHSNHNPWPQRTVRGARYKLIYNPLAGEMNPGYAFTMGRKFFKAPEAELLEAASKQVQVAYKIMKKPPKYELYDLQMDPFEFKNLAEDLAHAETLGRLKAELTSWQKRTGDPLEDPAIAQKLFSMIRESGTSKKEALDYKLFMQTQ
jgi:N-sulfoglucosamine sulfohydrolase